MLRKSFLIIFIFCSYYAKAQDAIFAWAKSFGSTEDDIGRKIVRNACGDIYCTGYFSETVDLDPGPGVFNATSNGSMDIYISKFDGAGNFIWAKHIGGSGYDEAANMISDVNGDLYITGVFRDVVDFDPGPAVTTLYIDPADQGAFLLKIDTTGNFLWVKQITDKGSIYGGNTTKISASGNIYIAGQFHGTADFDPGPAVFNLTATVPNWDDIYVSKLNSNGDLIWAKQFAGSFLKYATGLEIDNRENIFISGIFAGTVDFDPGPAVYNVTSTVASIFSDIFIVKLDVVGNFGWAKKMGGNNSVLPRTMAMDSQFNIYIAGDFYGHIDFNPGPGFFFLDGYGNYPAAFIVKLTANGDLIWAQRFGGQNGSNSSATALDIALDISGNLYTSGIFSGIVDFSPLITLTSAQPGADLFVMKLLSDGNTSFVKQMGGVNAQSSGISINTDAANNIYVTGTLYGATIDYDPGPGGFNISSNGESDAFMLKLSQCDQPTSATIKKTICSDTANTYTVGCKTYTTNGIYSQVLINAAGCDSIVTLDLTFSENPHPKLGPDKEQCIDSTNSFLLQTENNYTSYEWSTGQTTPTISAQNIGEYWVKVKNIAGCKGSDTIKIIKKQCVIDLYMPSAFSPNNDGLNDVLKPGVYGTLASFKMEVFNRFGQVIFKSNDPNKGWDGKLKGTPAPVGVYVWQCYYQFQNKGLEYQKGTVTIIR